MKIKDSVALITGGGRGIGEVCAKQLAKAGAKVSICDLIQEGIDRVVKDIKDAGGEAIGVKGNVVSEEDQTRFVKQTIDAFNAYTKEVQSGQYPDAGHSYHMKSGEMEKLQQLLKDKI